MKKYIYMIWFLTKSSFFFLYIYKIINFLKIFQPLHLIKTWANPKSELERTGSNILSLGQSDDTWRKKEHPSSVWQKEKRETSLQYQIYKLCLKFANFLATPDINAIVKIPLSMLQASINIPLKINNFGILLPELLLVEFGGASVSDELSSTPKDLGNPGFILVVIWAINAGRESGTPDALAFWYARKPGSNFLTVPHIPCLAPSFAISHGIPISSWWKSNTSQALKPSPILDSTAKCSEGKIS